MQICTYLGAAVLNFIFVRYVIHIFFGDTAVCMGPLIPTVLFLDDTSVNEPS